MTKLMQWLFGLTLFGGIWTALVTDSVPLDIPAVYKEMIWMLPIYLVIGFGCYSVGVIAYRVAIFNDCEEAAQELKEQIEMAKKDLKRRGFKDS